MNKILSTLLLLLCTLSVSNVATAAYVWTFDSDNAPYFSGYVCPGGVCSQTDSDGGTSITATATGWYSETAANAAISQANRLRIWDGLSVEATSADTGTPQHATDNEDWYDSVLFDFGGASVELDQVTMGWHTDTDFSLLRYTGNGTPTLAGNSYSSLTATQGWELVANYFCNCSNSASGSDITFNVNSGDESSGFWLIAALNPSYFNDSRYIGNDHFKIKTLSGVHIPEIPVPAAFWLFGTALIGFLKVSRKAKA